MLIVVPNVRIQTNMLHFVMDFCVLIYHIINP